MRERRLARRDELLEQAAVRPDRSPDHARPDRRCAGGDPEPARAAAVRAAALANSVREETSNRSALHIVGQIRLTAVDLLRAAGLDRSEAQRLVRSA